MLPSRKWIHDHSDGNQRSAEPEREAVRFGRRSILNGLEFLQKKSEARHHEAEAHQSEAGADPRKNGALGSQVIVESGVRIACYRTIHSAASHREGSAQSGARNFATPLFTLAGLYSEGQSERCNLFRTTVVTRARRSSSNFQQRCGRRLARQEQQSDHEAD